MRSVVFLVVLLTACGSREPPKSATTPGASSTPPPSPSGSAEAPPPDGGTKQRGLEVVNQLTGGALERAQRACANEPDEEREACVDARMAEHDAALDAKVERNMRSMELLRLAGEAECTKATPSEKKDCVLGAMNQKIVELSRACPEEPEAQHQCMVGKILERYGP